MKTYIIIILIFVAVEVFLCVTIDIILQHSQPLTQYNKGGNMIFTVISETGTLHEEDIDVNDITDVRLPNFSKFDPNYHNACVVEFENDIEMTIIGYSREEMRHLLGW